MASIHSEAFWKALVKAGVFNEGEHITRVIIDAKVGHTVVMYVVKWGGEALLDPALMVTLRGAEKHEAEAG